MIAAVLAVDCAVLASIPHAAPLLGPLAPFGIVSFAVFVGLGYRKLQAYQAEIPFQSSFFCAHLACVGSVSLANLWAQVRNASWLEGRPAQLVSGAIVVLGVVLLALACMPVKAWLRAASETSPAWQYAVAAGVAAWCLRSPFQALWIHSSSADIYVLQVIAFRAVQAILGLILPDLVVDAGPFVIGTPRFMVSIGAPCSGIEGLGLVLVFTTVWLWFFRKEMRYPRAFLLVPCALLSVFLLNIVRIAVLILIGNAGAPDVAFIGFHSQAGWIAFTLVALGFSMAAQRLKWIRKESESGLSEAAKARTAGTAIGGEAREAAAAESPATAAYLVPFLAILGASFLAKSASGSFEWLYPLRFFAALIALWVSRHELRKLNWHFGWAAPLTGAGIFLIWVAPNMLHHPVASPLGVALASLSPAARTVWIVLRAAAAVITVPIAEELAFRGYLARRIMARDFTEIPFARLSLLAIGLSSAAFGVMHGQHWLVGIVAGLCFAAVLRHRGRIGDAVIAHAVANLLLAAWVLARGDFGLW